MRATFSKLRLLLLVVLLASGCARKLPPTGGPPDVSAPTLQASEPDSGRTSVPRDAIVRLVFSEPMDRASVGQSVVLGPGVRNATAKWLNGRTIELTPDGPLPEGRTITLIVPPDARDVRGNPLDRVFTAHFTTAAAFPPGEIAGTIVGRGLSPGGIYVWAYRDDLGHAPDSTAFDMDALDRSQSGGHFTLPGLPVPGTYRLFAFVDRNRNRSYEPTIDLLSRSDSLVALSPDAPRAADVRLIATDPEAVARVEGTVIDSLAPGNASLRVEARGVPTGTAIAADRVPIVVIDVTEGRFAGSLRSGRWRLVAWRDLDNDRARSPAEPVSAAAEVDLDPGEAEAPVTLVLQPAPGTESPR